MCVCVSACPAGSWRRRLVILVALAQARCDALALALALSLTLSPPSLSLTRCYAWATFVKNKFLSLLRAGSGSPNKVHFSSAPFPATFFSPCAHGLSRHALILPLTFPCFSLLLPFVPSQFWPSPMPHTIGVAQLMTCCKLYSLCNVSFLFLLVISLVSLFALRLLKFCI